MAAHATAADRAGWRADTSSPVLPRLGGPRAAGQPVSVPSLTKQRPIVVAFVVAECQFGHVRQSRLHGSLRRLPALARAAESNAEKVRKSDILHWTRKPTQRPRLHRRLDAAGFLMPN